MDNNCILDVAAAIQEIENIITDPVWIDANIADECFAGWSPCGTYPWQYKEITYKVPVCWKKYNFIDDENESHILIVACDQKPWCVTKYKVCWDGQNFQQVPVSGPDMEGSGTCDTEEPSDPLPNQYSSCYYIPGDCWP